MAAVSGLVMMGSRAGVLLRLGVTAALLVGLGLHEGASLTQALGATPLMAMSSFMASVRRPVATGPRCAQGPTGTPSEVTL